MYVAGYYLEKNVAADAVSPNDLPGSTNLIYNIGIIYAKSAFRADLNYNHTGEQRLNLNTDAPDFYLQPTRRLDLTMQYHFPIGLVASIAMQNLPDALASSEITIPGTHDGATRGVTRMAECQTMTLPSSSAGGSAVSISVAGS